MEFDRWGKQVRIRFGDRHSRMGGMTDLLLMMSGWAVHDVGCNRGHMCYHFAQAGARVVHGCDYFSDGINVCREVFADLKCESQFEVVDLARDAEAGFVRAFGRPEYDLIMFSAVIHKLRRQMTEDELGRLLTYLGGLSTQYVAARVDDQDRWLLEQSLPHFSRVHWSLLDGNREQGGLGQCIVLKRAG